MILYLFVDIYIEFQGFLICCRKGENLPTYPHTNYPQAVDNLWIIWAHIQTN